MKNTYAIFVNDEEFTCEDFYDLEGGFDSISVFNEKKVCLGDIIDIAIPDIDSEIEEVEYFENFVSEWIVENY